jgi:hypothetical protein
MVMAPGPERPDLNYGSKIFLPASALDKVSKLHVQWPLLLELINGEKGKHSHAGVLEFVAEEGRAYLPHWMMETLGLDVGDMIQVKTTSLELARLVKLQPQSVNFLEITDPKAVLEKAFRNFATLTKGDVFNFEYNDEIYYVAVLDVKPETPKMGVSMIETDVSVDFAPPVGYVEPERQPRGSGTSTPASGRGGVPAGGVLHHRGTMAQAIGYQAIAPSTLATMPSNFAGEGQRLVIKKCSKTSKPQPSTPCLRLGGTRMGRCRSGCRRISSSSATRLSRSRRWRRRRRSRRWRIISLSLRVRDRVSAGRQESRREGMAIVIRAAASLDKSGKGLLWAFLTCSRRCVFSFGVLRQGGNGMV